MIIVIANHLPHAVRGRMKLWFVEPKPNVFVSGINDSVARSVVKYLKDKCPLDSGLMIFTSKKTAPGFDIHTFGQTSKELVLLSGLQLVNSKTND